MDTSEYRFAPIARFLLSEITFHCQKVEIALPTQKISWNRHFVALKILHRIWLFQFLKKVTLTPEGGKI